MLIPLSFLVDKYHISLKGIVHIGAHECEERTAYQQQHISDNKVLWVEGQHDLVEKNKKLISSLKIYEDTSVSIKIQKSEIQELFFKQKSKIFDRKILLDRAKKVYLTK